MHDAIETIDATVATLRAVNAMLGCLIDSGDDHKRHAYAIERLLEQQCDDIDNALVAIRDGMAHFRADCIRDEDELDPLSLRELYTRNLKEARPTSAWVDTLARTSGLTPDGIEKVLDAVEAWTANDMVNEYTSLQPHRAYLARKRAGAMPGEADVEEALRVYREADAKAEAAGDNLAEGPIPDHFRAEALAERLSEGVDPARIAKAVNLKPETVERVIAQLLADPAELDKATGTEG